MAIVRILEAADEAATFPRFFDLPPELRNRIYSMHFDSFPVLSRPTTPPIARASRQLRQETTLLFYQSCNIYLSIGRATPNYKPKPPRTLTHLSEEYLGYIRHIEVSGPIVPMRRRRWGWAHVAWQVDLGATERGALMSGGRTSHCMADIMDGFEERRDRVERRLKVVLEGIAAREGMVKLRNGDGNALVKVFQHSSRKDKGE